MARLSAWVYDVAALAFPLQEELGKIGDWNQAVANAKADAQQFVDAVRQALRASDKEIAWFAPGQLLVIGTARTHAQAADVLAQLANPQAKPAGSLAALHQKTSQRAAKRGELPEKLRQLSRLRDTVAAHDEFGWNLLAAALDGQLELESLTELQIAWKSDATKKMFEGKAPVIALRSAWAITAASRALPDEKELAALADSVRKRCRPAAEEAMASLKDNPEDISAILVAVYAAMAVNEAALSAQVLDALPDEPPADSPKAGAILAARGLLSKPGQINREQVEELITTSGVAGEDVTVLVALACRRAGGETWSAFRAQMRGLLGEQPLPGSVVVLANRLSGSLPLVMNR
jgi:hypothetical protein